MASAAAADSPATTRCPHGPNCPVSSQQSVVRTCSCAWPQQHKGSGGASPLRAVAALHDHAAKPWQAWHLNPAALCRRQASAQGSRGPADRPPLQHIRATHLAATGAQAAWPMCLPEQTPQAIQPCLPARPSPADEAKPTHLASDAGPQPQIKLSLSGC